MTKLKMNNNKNFLCFLRGIKLQSINLKYNFASSEMDFKFFYRLIILLIFTALNNNFYAASAAAVMSAEEPSSMPQLRLTFESLRETGDFGDVQKLRLVRERSTSENVRYGLRMLVSLNRTLMLNLSYCQLNAADIEPLSSFFSLRILDLRNNHVGDLGAAFIGELTGLTTLNLSENNIGDDGAIHIGKLTSLTTLDLSNNRIGNDGAAHIGKLGGLTILYLANNRIGNDGAAHIGKLAGLTALDLSENNIGVGGAAHIGKLINLTWLRLVTTNIEAEGIVHLTKLYRLTCLDLQYNRFSRVIFGASPAAKAISKFSPSLQTLLLSSSTFGEDSMRLITAALPTTDVKFWRPSPLARW